MRVRGLGSADGAQPQGRRRASRRRYSGLLFSLLHGSTRRDAPASPGGFTNGLNDSERAHGVPNRDQRHFVASDNSKKMPQLLHQRIE
jgi:hypothetical protein